MKSKILLSTLLGGALLAGCTADDALEVNKVAQNVNPASPVFTVSFDNNDDPSMRAVMGDSRMAWETIDKMSLYHGGGKAWDTSNPSKPTWVAEKFDNSEFLQSGAVKQFDAIYTQVGDGAEAVFATQSMVNEGLAIMVFPADTTYSQNGTSPVISIDPKQTEATKHSTPYVSEVLEITAYGDYNAKNDVNKHSAGYGRQYDLRLRRIGAQLRLKLNAINDENLKKIEDVEPVDFRRVSITTSDTDKKPFTTKMWVKVGQLRGQYDENSKEYSETVVGDNVLGHKYWKYSPWIEPTDDADAKTNEISTSDIGKFDDVPTAYFTLLPTEDRPEAQYNRAVEPDNTANYGDVTIEVDTRYGFIEIKDTDDQNDKKWSSRTGEDAEKLNTGLGKTLLALFPTQAKTADTYPLYRNQVTAGAGARSLEVDMSKLNMNNLHIESEEHLLDAIKVYHALYDNKAEEDRDITFILDGDSKNNVFAMTQDGLKVMEDEMKSTETLGYGLKFQACRGITGEVCENIKVTNTGSTAEEVPSYLNFETSSVVLQLDKAWKYTTVTDKNNAVDPDKKKDLTNVSKIEVLADATLNLQNNIAVKDNQLTDGVVVDYKGTVTVTGKVEVRVKMDNYGTIEIPANSATANQLRVGNNMTLTNMPSQAKDSNGNYITSGLNTDQCGVINNYGWLDCVKRDGENNTINNYGIINQKASNAVTLITTNSNSQGLKGNFNKDNNAIGSIVLYSVDAQNDLVVVDKAQGFIKLTIDSQEKLDANGAYGDKANYIILTGSCNLVRTGKSSDGKIDYTPSNISFFEISEELTGTTVKFEDLHAGTATDPKANFAVRAIVVPEGKIVNIPDGTTMQIGEEACVEGSVIEGGTFDTKTKNATFNGYFNGPKSQSDNVSHVGGNRN